MKDYQKIPSDELTNTSELNNTNIIENNNESNKLTIISNEKINFNKKNSNKNDKSYINKKRNERLFFWPFCTIVFTLSAYFWSNYFVYRNDDINYRKKEYYIVWFIYFWLELTYILSSLVIPKQTNIEKYFSMNNNLNNLENKELNFLNEDQWYANCEFCKKKKFYKSSHCRMCKTCIIFRDHHCPWIANCVGYQNIQYFNNLIIWGSIGTTFYIINFIKFWFKYDIIKEKNPDLNLNWFKILMFLIIFFIDGYMDFNNIFLFFSINNAIFNNLTKIENLRVFGYENYFCCIKNNNDKKNYHNRFNIGFFITYYYLIGPTILHYFFPLPKFQNLPINECSPIFNKIKYPNKLFFYKEIINIDNKYIYLVISELNDPNYFIEICHKNYNEEQIKLIK